MSKRLTERRIHKRKSKKDKKKKNILSDLQFCKASTGPDTRTRYLKTLEVLFFSSTHFPLSRNANSFIFYPACSDIVLAAILSSPAKKSSRLEDNLLRRFSLRELTGIQSSEWATGWAVVKLLQSGREEIRRWGSGAGWKGRSCCRAGEDAVVRRDLKAKTRRGPKKGRDI